MAIRNKHGGGPLVSILTGEIRCQRLAAAAAVGGAGVMEPKNHMV
jgi:hypothetical protein